MGREYKKCINEMRKKARQGKLKSRFAVREDDLRRLENDGFKVEVLSHKYREDNMGIKNLIEVTVSWAVPTKGVAKKLKVVVEKYRKKYNDIARSKKARAARIRKNIERLIEWRDLDDYIPLLGTDENDDEFGWYELENEF